MLADNVAAQIEQGFRRLAFEVYVEPGVCDLNINLRVRIYGFNAHCKRVAAAGNLGVGVAHRADITDFIRLGFKTRRNAGEVTRLVDTAEIVVEVLVVALIARTMREVYVGILLGKVGHGIHIAPACTEDDVAAGLDAFLDCRLCRGGVAVANVVLADNLVVRKAEVLLHGNDALVMRVGIARAVARVADVDNAHLNLVLGNTCRLCAAAG